MPENCKDLSANDVKNIFMGSSEINLGESRFQQPFNRNNLFNFSEEHFAKVLEGFWTGRKDRNLSSTAEMALIIIYSFLIVAGLIANILVSFVVARRKQMHTARNLYIVNLTVSDISLCLICMPFTLVMILRRHWTLGPMLCKLVSLLQGTNIMVSVGTITVIALDRYCTICKPSAQKVEDTRRKVLFSILLIWVISILVALPLFFYQIIEPVIIDHCVIYEVCIEQWPSQNYRVSYAVAVLLIMAVIPPLVVGAVHAKIAKYLNTHARTQKDSRRAHKELERNKKTTFLLSARLNCLHTRVGDTSNNYLVVCSVILDIAFTECQITAIYTASCPKANDGFVRVQWCVGSPSGTIGIVIIFAISWLPLGCFSLLADLETYSNSDSSENLQNSTQRIYIGLAIVHVIAMSSAISNPIVYGWMNSNIRHEFLQLLPIKFGRKTRVKNEGPTTGIENDTTRTQIHYNFTDNNDAVVKKECTALLVTLNEGTSPVKDSGSSEAL